MVRAATRVTRSLRGRLALATVLAVLLWALVAGAIAYTRAFDQAHQLQDDVLHQVANQIFVPPSDATNLANGGSADPEADIVIQQLGRLDLRDSAPDLPATMTDGLHTVSVDGQQLRVMVRTLPTGDRVAASQSVVVRDEIAHEAAFSAIVPLLALAPVLLVLVVAVTSVVLRPLQRMARDLATRPDGELHPISLRGAPSEFVTFGSALNQLLRRSAAVLDSQRRFAAEAAHELRTPIAAVSLQAEHLSTAPSQVEHDRRLAALQLGLARVRHLCDQLIDFAQADSYRATDLPTGSAREILLELSVELEPAVSAKQIDFSLDVSLDQTTRVPELVARLAWGNVLDNALRYAPDGGTVHVDARHVGTGSRAAVEILVEDDGPGVEDPDAVLVAFHRATDQSIPGSGLGLAITQQALQRCGGSLEFEPSQRFSQGTRVRISTPVSSHTPA